MRTTITLIPAVAVAFLSLSAYGQVDYDVHLTFDPSSELSLDSIYPVHAWQVGHPVKTVFDSAYSAPNALVTDTLLPYPLTSTDYAEFSFPIDVFGESIDLTFEHRMDMDSGEGYGWVEYFNPMENDWVRMGSPNDPWSMMGITSFYAPEGTATDSGVVFTGTHTDWNSAQFTLTCIAVFHGEEERGGAEFMRYRFAFQGIANPAGRDGWMIDNVRAINYGMCSGLSTIQGAKPTLSPSPADQYVRIEVPAGAGIERVELIAMDGHIVRSEQATTSPLKLLDVSTVPHGMYAVLASTGSGEYRSLLVVQH